MPIEAKSGTIVAVCRSGVKDYPKYPQAEVYVGWRGIDKDAHAGYAKRRFTKPRIFFKPNNREVSIVADEVRQAINQDLGLNIQPGGFNENLLISGLGDLGDIKGGSLMVFESGVELLITEQNSPCEKLEQFHQAKMIKATTEVDESEVRNKRGLVAVVFQMGQLRPGERFSLVEDWKYPTLDKPEPMLVPFE